MRKGIYIIAFVLLLTGCGSNMGSTEADNPNLPILDENFPDPSHPPTPALSRAMTMLRSAICSRLTEECGISPLTFDECTAQLDQNTELVTALNIASKSLLTVADVIQAENSSSIAEDRQATSACVNAVVDISCPDLQASSAYQASAPYDFSNIATLLSTDKGSCPDIF